MKYHKTQVKENTFNLHYSYCEHLQCKMCIGCVVRGFNLADAKATLKGRTTL